MTQRFPEFIHLKNSGLSSAKWKICKVGKKSEISRPCNNSCKNNASQNLLRDQLNASYVFKLFNWTWWERILEAWIQPNSAEFGHLLHWGYTQHLQTFKRRLSTKPLTTFRAIPTWACFTPPNHHPATTLQLVQCKANTWWAKGRKSARLEETHKEAELPGSTPWQYGPLAIVIHTPHDSAPMLQVNQVPYQIVIHTKRGWRRFVALGRTSQPMHRWEVNKKLTRSSP